VGLGLVAAALIGREKSTPQRSDDLLLRHDPVFRWFFIANLVGAYGYTVPLVYLVAYARHAGFTDQSAAEVGAVLGAASAVGRIAVSMAADRLGRLTLLTACTGAMSIVVFLWPLCSTHLAILVFAVMFGLTASGWVALPPALVREYFGQASIRRTLGTAYSAQVFGCLLAPPITGTLFDVFGNYTLATSLAGLSLAANFLVLTRIPFALVVTPRLQGVEPGEVP
jgi:MFS family permease